MKRGHVADARRGMAIVAVVVMIAIIHITVMGAVTRGGAEADILALRIETVRAFFAADSGVIIWLREDAAGSTPDSGESVSIGSQKVLWVDSPEAGETGTLVVEGQSGRARRRLSVELE